MNANKILKRIQGILILPVWAIFFTGCAGLEEWGCSSLVADDGNKAVIEAFSRTVRPIPGDADAQYGLARHFQKQGRYKIAVEAFITVLKIDPEHFRAYNGLGVCYDQLRQFDLAAMAYAQALALEPDIDYVHNNIGYSKLLQSEPEQAAAAFENALALNPEHPVYQNNLALAISRIAAQDLAGNHVSVSDSIPASGKIESLVPPESRSSESEKIDGNTAADVVKQSEERTTFYAVQIGVVYSLEHAVKIMKKARNSGYPDPYINTVERGEKTYYRIRFGKFSDRSKARQRAVGIVDQFGKPCYPVMESLSMTRYFSNRFQARGFRI